MASLSTVRASVLSVKDHHETEGVRRCRRLMVKLRSAKTGDELRSTLESLGALVSVDLSARNECEASDILWDRAFPRCLLDSADKDGVQDEALRLILTLVSRPSGAGRMLRSPTGRPEMWLSHFTHTSPTLLQSLGVWKAVGNAPTLWRNWTLFEGRALLHAWTGLLLLEANETPPCELFVCVLGVLEAFASSVEDSALMVANERLWNRVCQFVQGQPQFLLTQPVQRGATRLLQRWLVHDLSAATQLWDTHPGIVRAFADGIRTPGREAAVLCASALMGCVRNGRLAEVLISEHSLLERTLGLVRSDCERLLLTGTTILWNLTVLNLDEGVTARRLAYLPDTIPTLLAVLALPYSEVQRSDTLELAQELVLGLLTNMTHYDAGFAHSLAMFPDALAILMRIASESGRREPLRALETLRNVLCHGPETRLCVLHTVPQLVTVVLEWTKDTFQTTRRILALEIVQNLVFDMSEVVNTLVSTPATLKDLVNIVTASSDSHGVSVVLAMLHNLSRHTVGVRALCDCESIRESLRGREGLARDVLRRMDMYEQVGHGEERVPVA